MVATLFLVNLAAGAAGAYALARRFRGVEGREVALPRQYGIFISVYFIECVSMVLGMGIPIFSVFLSFVWAAIFGMRLSKWDSRPEVLKASFLLSLYSSLPAMSFIIVPIAVLSGGGDITSVESGYRFGIPQFSFVPAPMRTILGFYTTLVLGGLAFKTVVTVGGVVVVGRGGKRSTRSDENDD